MMFCLATCIAFKTSQIIFGDSWSEISSNGFEIGSNSMWASLIGRKVSLVCLQTQLYICQKHLQYKPTDRTIMLTATIEVPMVKNILTFTEDQKLCGYVLHFISILFMLKIDTHFISRILLARTCNP